MHRLFYWAVPTWIKVQFVRNKGPLVFHGHPGTPRTILLSNQFPTSTGTIHHVNPV